MIHFFSKAKAVDNRHWRHEYIYIKDHMLVIYNASGNEIQLAALILYDYFDTRKQRISMQIAFQLSHKKGKVTKPPLQNDSLCPAWMFSFTN